MGGRCVRMLTMSLRYVCACSNGCMLNDYCWYTFSKILQNVISSLPTLSPSTVAISTGLTTPKIEHLVLGR